MADYGDGGELVLKAAAVLHLLGRTGISCNLKQGLKRGEALGGMWGDRPWGRK